MTAPLPIACLVSGSGSNLQAIIDRTESGGLAARIACVISNTPGARALERARRHAIPEFTVDHRLYPSRGLFEQELIGIIDRHGARLVCLCGFLRVLTGTFVRHYPNRILNIHPALLPDFGGPGFHGIKVHQAVLAAGRTISGCTVHMVDAEVDHGPVILQRTVPVLPGDTAEVLAARVLEQEHLAYAEAIELFAQDRVVIRGGRAEIAPPMIRRLSTLTGGLGPAALSAFLLWLAFPPLALWPLALVALVPLLLSLDRAPVRRVFWRTWLFGLLFYAGLLHWIVYNPAVEPWVRPLLYLGVVLIAALQGLYAAAAAAAARWLGGRTRLPFWLACALAWTVADYLRGLGPLGFTWGSAGYALAAFPPAIQTAEFAGMWGVTFWVVLVNCMASALIAGGWRRLRSNRQERGSLIPALAGMLTLLLPAAWGCLRLGQVERDARSVPAVRAALIQGNIEQGVRWDGEYQDFNWRTYRDLTRRAAAERPALVVWPETALPFYLRHQQRYLSGMCALTSEAGVAVLTGVPDYLQDMATGRIDFYNSSFLFLPGRGLAGQYAKSHLVPFGERFPFKERIPGLRHVSFGEGEWTPGADTALFALDSLRFANLICFESTFPAITRAQTRRGARFLVNITNDGWFGRSGAARQHADMAVMRAVETRRAIARCANSGVSLFVLPTGRRLDPTPLFVQAVVTSDIPAMTALTFYVRYGDWLMLAFSLLLGVASLFAILGPRPADRN